MKHETPPPLKAVIYVRQSHAKEESISLDVQEAACRTHAAQHGYTVLKVLPDPGISGLQYEKRPSLMAALAMIESGAAQVIIVWRWSRLSRDRFHQAVLLNRIESAGGRAESALEPVDVTTAGGVMNRDMFMSYAAFESNQKSESWKEAQAVLISKGKPHGGGARLGYVLEPIIIDGVKKGHRILQHPVNGPAVRKAYLDYIGGKGFQKIAMELNGLGVTTTRTKPAQKPIGANTLIRSMDSGFAAGKLVSRRGGVTTFRPGKHEPLINEDEWAQYLAKRADRKATPVKLRAPRWWLSGVVRCGHCDGALGISNHNATKSQAVCLTYKNSRTCKGTWINRSTVERRIALWLGGRLDELARYGWDDTHRAEERGRLQKQLDDLAAERGRLDASLAKLSTGWATGFLDDAAYRVGRSDLEGKRQAADAAHADLYRQLDALLPTDSSVYDRLLHLGDDMTSSEYNALIKRVVKTVTVYADTLVVQPVLGESCILPRRAASDSDVVALDGAAPTR